jgi:acyl-CoA synthetase (AMP-forming)/AMP-acid ligase II
VFGIPNEEWGESVAAAAVPSRPEVTAEDIKAYAREHLAGYKVPRTVVFMDELPKTGSGKVLKRQLRDQFASAGS